MRVSTHDGLALEFAADGHVAAAEVGGAPLPLASPGGFCVEEVLRPDGRCRELGWVRGEATEQGGAVEFRGQVANAALDLMATFRGGEYIEVRGEIADRAGVDRALKVTFVLPLDLTDWRWENTAFCARRIEPGQEYPGRPNECLYLGRKGETFADEDHEVYGIAINKLPFSAVTRSVKPEGATLNRSAQREVGGAIGGHPQGHPPVEDALEGGTPSGAGLAIAYPVHEPRVFLIRARSDGYAITFSLGVTPLTEKSPSRASFRFIIYRIDPAWGLRSAAERYYGFFPDLFATEATRHGNHGGSALVMHEAKVPERCEDFGIAYAENDFQWTEGEMTEAVAARAKALGLTVFHWREPWDWFHQGPGPEASADSDLALLRSQAAGLAPGGGGTGQYCGAPQSEMLPMALNCFMLTEAGKLMRVVHTFDCWMLPMNVEPDLPGPNRAQLALDWQFRYLRRWGGEGFRGPRGVAWDSFDDWSGFRRLNFRREHFRTMAAPATFDPASGVLCQVVGFHDWAFARHHAGLVRAAGGLVMANANLEHSLLYGGQFIDVLVRERLVADCDEERLSVIRMLMRSKPISFIGRDWGQPEAEWAPRLAKLLLFGIAPGSTLEESQRGILKTYMPALSAAAEAGWQPVTHARGAGLLVERFGAAPPRLYFTVANRTAAPVDGRVAAPVDGRVAVDLAALGLADRADTLSVAEVLLGRPLQVLRSAGTLTAELHVAPGETLVLALQKP